MAAYAHAPGETPREVLVQRTRKAYQRFDLQAAIRHQGLDSAVSISPDDPRSHFELELFDDDTLETRTHAEWVPDSGADPATARVLVTRCNGAATLAPARVVAVDAATNRYQCHLEPGYQQDDRGPRWLHRLCVCFDAEDPEVFCERLARAERVRRDTEAALLHSLLVDSMPHADVPQLNVEVMNRVLGHALSTKSLKAQMKLIDTTMLVNEANIEYARTLNAITFDSIASPPPPRPAVDGAAPHAAVAVLAHLLPLPLPISAPRTLVPRRPLDRGTVALPEHDFPAAFSHFVFTSLLTKSEIISALGKVRAECVKVMDKALFHRFPQKTLPILDLVQVRQPFVAALCLCRLSQHRTNVGCLHFVPAPHT